MSRELGIPFLGSIPLDVEIVESGNEGRTMLRVAHSVIYIFFRKLVPRAITFFVSNVVLLAVWIWFCVCMFCR